MFAHPTEWSGRCNTTTCIDREDMCHPLGARCEQDRMGTSGIRIPWELVIRAKSQRHPDYGHKNLHLTRAPGDDECMAQFKGKGPWPSLRGVIPDRVTQVKEQ